MISRGNGCTRLKRSTVTRSIPGSSVCISLCDYDVVSFVNLPICSPNAFAHSRDKRGDCLTEKATFGTMAPKRKPKNAEPAADADIRVPSVDPLVAARHEQLDKWVHRLQEIARDGAHSRRLRGLLLTKQAELEASLAATNAAANDLAFGALRPPPPPAPAPNQPTPRQRSRSIVKIKGGPIAEAEQPPSWRPPEPSEIKRLTRIANEMMLQYGAPKEGFPPSPKKDKGAVARYRGGLPPIKPVSPTPSSVASPAAVPSAAESDQPSTAVSATTGNIGKGGSKLTPRDKGDKGGRTPRGGKADGRDGIAESRKASVVMASLSLAGGGETAAPPPDGGADNKKGSKRLGKGDPSPPTTDPSRGQQQFISTGFAGGSSSPKSGVFGEDESSFRPNRRGSRSLLASGSLNGSMFAEALIPYASVLERPSNISYANWDAIMRLRATRIDTSERISVIRANLAKAQARVQVVKERERLAAYSLLAAHKELHGTSNVLEIPGLPPGVMERVVAALGDPYQPSPGQLASSDEAMTDSNTLPPIGGAGKVPKSGAA